LSLHMTLPPCLIALVKSLRRLSEAAWWLLEKWVHTMSVVVGCECVLVRK
jgi:hypothetical protein